MDDHDPSLMSPIENISAQELGLKYKSEEELFANLIQSGEGWTAEQNKSVEAAYNLARMIHQDDSYKDKPYIYHLLRVANRLTGYMHINDPEMVVAALLHDSVEDHPVDVIKANATKAETSSTDTLISEDLYERQQLAFRYLAVSFSPRVATLIASVTNAPTPKDREETYDEWLERYAQKVEQAASTPEGCLIKFADWCDNGLGIVHSDEPEGSVRFVHFKRKYSLALPVFERRFQDADVVRMLDPQARAYVVHQLTLGRERLAT